MNPLAPHSPISFRRIGSACALAVAVGLLGTGGWGQTAEPPDPYECPEGFYYHPREDGCVETGATLEGPMRPVRAAAPTLSKKTAECILQHIEKAQVNAAVEVIVAACQSLADQ